MLRSIIAIGTASVSLAACSTVQVADTGENVPQTAVVAYEEWPEEFAGRSVELMTAAGVSNVANLAPDGTLTVIPELSTVAVEGTWGTRGETLCTNVPAIGEECWSYQPVIAANGDWVKLQSSKGKIVSVRLLSEAEENMVEKGG